MLIWIQRHLSTNPQLAIGQRRRAAALRAVRYPRYLLREANAFFGWAAITLSSAEVLDNGRQLRQEGETDSAPLRPTSQP
jgi:hypothetical protein